MLNTPNFEKYRQGDTVQYLTNVLTILTDPLAATLNVANKRTALKNIGQELINKWQPNLGNQLTPEIAALDNERDRVFSGFKLTVDNWASNHYDPAIQNAAFIVSDNISAHGNKITIQRYQQETATLNAIISDCEGVHASHITTLGLGNWVTQLKNLNTTFDTKYLERNAQLATTEPGVIADLITQALAAFRALKSLLEARQSVAEADGDPLVPQYQSVAAQWNSLTNQYNDAVLRFAGNGADQPVETEPEAPTNP
jgi:hypothetical protein